MATDLKEIELKVKELEKKHGKVTVIEVEGKVAYFKKANRQTIGYAMTLMATDITAAYGAILNSCYIEGDREIIDDDDYFIGAMPHANELIAAKQAQVLKF